MWAPSHCVAWAAAQPPCLSFVGFVPAHPGDWGRRLCHHLQLLPPNNPHKSSCWLCPSRPQSWAADGEVAPVPGTSSAPQHTVQPAERLNLHFYSQSHFSWLTPKGEQTFQQPPWEAASLSPPFGCRN